MSARTCFRNLLRTSPCVRSLEWPYSAFPVRRTTEQKKINVKRERSLYALYATVEVSEFSYFVCFVESICFSAVTKTWPKRLFRKWLKNLRETRPKILVLLKTTLKMTRKTELTTRNILVLIAIKPLHENTTWKSIHENIPETNLTNVAFVANNLFKVRSGDRFFYNSCYEKRVSMYQKMQNEFLLRNRLKSLFLSS